MKRAWFLLVILLSSGGLLFSQSSIASGEVKGTVTDPSGAVIPGVTVTATNAATGLNRAIVTGNEGEYRFLLLPPGRYDVSAELSGFTTQVRKDVAVLVGEIVPVDFRLQVGMASETITVTGEAPVIEIERARQSETITETYIRNLPIDRRDYLTFTLLAPGVADSNAMADNSDFRVAQTRQSGLSFYGSNGRGNNVTIDGAETNDQAGGVRATLSQEAIQEFQINRSNYSAELGGASGGVINIVSKSGSNEIRGRVFGFFRDQALDAADPFAIDLVDGQPERVKPPSQRQQYGATLAFPIRKDHTFLFAAFEGLNRRESGAVPVLTDLSIFQPTQPQASVIAALASNPSPAPVPCLTSVPAYRLLPPAICAQVLTATLSSKPSTIDLFEVNSGVFPFTTNSKSFSVRLDHQPSDQNQFFLRYNYTRSNESNQNTRALLGVTRSNSQYILDSTVVGGWTRVVNPNLVNEARIQWNYRNFDVMPNDPYGPELNLPGYGFFNRDIFLPNYSIERRYEMADNLSLIRRNHRLKFGATLLIRGARADSYTFMGGRFNFGALPGALVSPQLAATSITTLQAFDLGLPQFYQQGFGDPSVSSNNPYIAFYAQDSWSIRPNFTLNYGLRYELDHRRDPIQLDTNNLAPRLGFAWDPWSNKRTVIRGGAGIYYSPIYYQIDHVVNSLNEINGYRQIAQVATTLDPVNPLAINGPINIYQTLRAQGVIGVPNSPRSITPDDLAQFGITITHTGPRPPLTVLFRIAPNYVNPYAVQSSLGVEHELSPGLSVSGNYIFVRTLKITRARDINLLPRPLGPSGISDWTAATGCTGAGLPNCFRDPSLLQENMYESSAQAFYHGFILELNKRFSNDISLAGNYTYSKAVDEVTDFNTDFEAMDQTNLRLERALSSFDQRHKVVLYAYLQSPFHTGAAASAWEKVLADFMFTPIFRANSARPFNLLVGSELNGDRHNTTDRPAFAGRNTGIGPAFWTLDLRLARRILLGSENRNLELIFEAFNIFNHQNYMSINNTVGPNFAAPFRVEGRTDRQPTEPLGFTSAFDPRRIQLGFRLSF